jgi:ComF family protein
VARRRDKVSRMFDAALNWLFPPPCVLCADSCGPLCGACAKDLRTHDHACPICGEALPPALAGHPCGRCLKRPPGFDRTRCAWPFEHPLDGVIRRFKFGGELALGRWLAERWLHAVTIDVQACPDVLVAIPLGSQRFAERGFNQARELLRVWAPALGCAVRDGALVRKRETAAQSALDRAARRRNVRNAFVWLGAPPPPHVVLVDDVMTTGATLDAAARVLKRAGAKRVDVWVLARA